MLLADPFQMVSQCLDQRSGQQRHAILSTLAVPNDDFSTAEVEVLDPQVAGFQQPQAGSVQKRSHEARHPLDVGQDPGHLVGSQDYGKASRALGPDQIVEPG